jgi:hypothetical protein
MLLSIDLEAMREVPHKQSKLGLPLPTGFDPGQSADIRRALALAV